MYDHNQVEIPESFVALFVVDGRLKPAATREFVGKRYEFCEDLAQHLFEYARAQHFDLGIAESEVLERCHRGLLSDGSGADEAEAAWVVRRLAEIEGWARRRNLESVVDHRPPSCTTSFPPRSSRSSRWR
jgi:hypothetical protein